MESRDYCPDDSPVGGTPTPGGGDAVPVAPGDPDGTLEEIIQEGSRRVEETTPASGLSSDLLGDPSDLLADSVKSVLAELSGEMKSASRIFSKTSAESSATGSPAKQNSEREDVVYVHSRRSKGAAMSTLLTNSSGSSKAKFVRTPTFTSSTDRLFFIGLDNYTSATPAAASAGTEHLSTYGIGEQSQSNLLSIQQTPYFTKSRGDTEELLRSDLAGVTVRCRRLEEEIRDTRSALEDRGLQVEELGRQLDAHRQEHARQAATIISLRTRLQESEEAVSGLQASLQRAELTAAALTRDGRRQADRIHELEDRLRTQLEEREGAEQRGEASQKQLGELVTTVTSILGVPRGGSGHLLTDTLAKKLSDLVKEAANLRREKSQLGESVHHLTAATDGARQTVGRLVNQLDEERRNLAQQLLTNDTLRKDEEEMRTKLRTAEEELVSLRDRLHSSNKSCSSALEELHSAETKLQRSRDDYAVLDHRRQQSEVEWKGVLNTIASLVSAGSVGALEGQLVKPTPEDITHALQARVSTIRETHESAERLKHQLNNLEDQVSLQTELYEAATKRAQRAEEEARGQGSRIRALEADLHASEHAREDSAGQKDKSGRLLSRLVGALGLQELGDDVTSDPDLVVCRAQQLAKLEGDKIVDKTTTVYQLQRKVKALRESVDRKELHLDMLRRKLALNEETMKAAKHVEDEKDDLLGRYRRQTRALERSSAEAEELRLQLRDLRAQMAAAGDYKSRAASLEERMEELSAKVTELEANRARHQRKLNQLKEQVRVANEQVLEERRVGDTTLDSLSHEVAIARQKLRDATRRERQLLEFRRVVMELLGAEGADECSGAGADYETLGRLQRLVAGQREMMQLSRRLDDVTLMASRPCSAHTLVSRSSSGRSLSPHRPVSASHPFLDNSHSRLPPLDSGLADLNAELRALTEHAHNHRSSARVLHSSPSRNAPPPNSSTLGRQLPRRQDDRSGDDCLGQAGRQQQPGGRSVGVEVPSSGESYPGDLPESRDQMPVEQHRGCNKSSPEKNRQASPSPNRNSPSPTRQTLSPSPTRQSPSPTRQHMMSARQSPRPGHRPTPSPSPILTRPGSATRRYSIGRANSVSFLEQDDESNSDDDDGVSPGQEDDDDTLKDC